MSKVHVCELLWYLNINRWDFDLQDEDNPFVYLDYAENVPEEIKDIPTANNSGLRYFYRIGKGIFHSYTKQNGVWYKEKEVYSKTNVYSVLFEPKVLFTLEEYRNCQKLCWSIRKRLIKFTPKLEEDMTWWSHQEEIKRIVRGIRGK